MKYKDLQYEMKEQLESKELFEQAKTYAFDYMDKLQKMDIYPSDEAILELEVFNEPLADTSFSAEGILEMLHKHGSKATVAQSGGKYLGFVCGGSLPVSLAAKWISDTWDQNCALFVLSPIASKLEEICEKWIVELLGLHPGTAAGFVSGSSTAAICAIAAARNELLLKQNWDVNGAGLIGAPQIRVVLGEQAHSSVYKALSLLGLGRDNVQLAPVDDQGRIILDKLPVIDSNTLLIVQAGNVNSGAFDPIDKLCDIANKAGAWIHVDGAFGLWAAASKEKCGLISGFEKADSWSADAHKTLNVPYDCGIVLCKNRLALVNTMQATGSYIQYSEQRDGMLYTPEMSRRARSIELWATLKYLGKSGINELIDKLCDNTKYFEERLSENGFTILNDVVFNQILVKCETAEKTKATLKYIQISGKCWCGGTNWQNEPAIRISICSWQTTRKDIDECIEAFAASRAKAGETAINYLSKNRSIKV